METWQDILGDVKLNFIEDFLCYKFTGKSTEKLVKLYLQDIKAIQAHIEKKDECKILYIQDKQDIMPTPVYLNI